MVTLGHDLEGFNGFGLNLVEVELVHGDLSHHHGWIGGMRIVLRRKRDIRVVRLVGVG